MKYILTVQHRHKHKHWSRLQISSCQHYLLRYLLSVSNSVCFSSILVARHWQHFGVLVFTQYLTSDFAENFGNNISCTERIAQSKDFELILTVKMEIRHTVEDQSGSEFSAICNRCGVMTAWSRKTLFFWRNFPVLQKRPLMVKFLKFCWESFHRDNDRHCCVQILWNLSDGKSVKLCVA